MTNPEPDFSPSSESDLPEGWAGTTLDQVLVALETGSRPPGGVRGILDGLPSIGGEHLNDDGGFRFENVKYVPKQFFERMSRGHIHKGDILVVKDGATTGKVSLVGDDFPYPSAVVNEHVFICRTTPYLDSRFLFRFLHSEEGQRRILENFRGSAQGGINQSFAPGTAVVIAPLAEQRRIVAKVEELLASVQAVRSRLARTTKLLKRFRQSVLAAACAGRLTADWRVENPDVEPASVLLARIVREKNSPRPPVPARSSPPGGARSQQKLAFVDDTVLAPPVARGGGGSDNLTFNERVSLEELPEVPETWRWCTAEQVCETITKGTTPSSEKMTQGTGEIPYVKVYNLTFDGSLDFTVKPTFVGRSTHNGELARSRVFPGDILMNIVGPPLGKVSVVPELYPEWNINQAIAFFRVLPDFDRSFFTICLLTESILSTISFRAKTTAGQHNLTLEQCRSLPLPLPSLAEQHEIVRRVERLFSLADAIERRTADASARADRLTQAVLAKAFRGELVPPEAELARQDGRDYEPASVLLERVRAERAAQGAASETKKTRGAGRGANAASLFD